MDDPLALLASVAARYSQKEIATLLGVDARTVRRWQTGRTAPPHYLADAIRQRLLPAAERPQPAEDGFAFVELNAGVGGLRLAFEAQGGHCVFASEADRFAQKTWLAHFRDGVPMAGALATVVAEHLPEHDVLLMGPSRRAFAEWAPGHPASPLHGTPYADLVRLVGARLPRAFVLEESRTLARHDGGRTFEALRRALEDGLGYRIHARVVDARSWVPQHRERLLVAGFREPTLFSWDDLQRPRQAPDLGTILHPEDGSEPAEPPYTAGPEATVDPRYTLSEEFWRYLQAQPEGSRGALVRVGDVAAALTSRYHKDGSDILVAREGGPPRRLTPRECARLMGFPDDLAIPVSDTQAYRQFGHGVVVPMMKEVARLVAPRVIEQLQEAREGVQQAPLIA